MKQVSEPSIPAVKDPRLSRIVYGIGKLGSVLRSAAWLAGQEDGLTPTQGQILVLLRGRPRAGIGLSEIAEELRVTPATASDAVATLVSKNLVEKQPSPDDGRAIAVRLSGEGRQAAWRAMQWSNFMVEALQSLSGEEQDAMMRGLTKALRSLHQSDRIPSARTCPSCTYFEPDFFDNPAGRHRCDYGNFAMADVDLRLDCSVYAAAPPAEAERIWDAFVGHEARE